MKACFRHKAKWDWKFSVAVPHYVCPETHPMVTMAEVTFTFRVEEDLKESFTAAARARDMTGAQLLRDFMSDFVKEQHEGSDHDLWFRHQVQAGLDSANSGNLVAAEDVEAEFSKRRKQTGA
ncbi:MAG: hypothetical protein U1E84_00405 [Rhodoferax sp.]